MSDLVEGVIKIAGRFTEKENNFIKANYHSLSDVQIANALNREPKSVTNRRTKMGLDKYTSSAPRSARGARTVRPTDGDTIRKPKSSLEYLQKKENLLKKSLSNDEWEHVKHRFAILSSVNSFEVTSFIDILNLVLAEIQVMRSIGSLEESIKAQELLDKLSRRMKHLVDSKVGFKSVCSTWPTTIKENFNKTCVACSSKKNICAHHIRCRRRWPNLVSSKSNGVALCQSCHTKFHNFCSEKLMPCDEHLLNEWLAKENYNFRVNWEIE